MNGNTVQPAIRHEVAASHPWLEINAVVLGREVLRQQRGGARGNDRAWPVFHQEPVDAFGLRFAPGAGVTLDRDDAMTPPRQIDSG